MSKLSARDVTVKVNGNVPAGLTDCTIELRTVFETSQTKFDPMPVDEPSYIDWSINISGEFGRETQGAVDAKTLKDASKAGDKVTASFNIHNPNSSPSDLTYEGQAIVSSYQESAPVDGKVTYSATLKAAGELTRKTT